MTWDFPFGHSVTSFAAPALNAPHGVYYADEAPAIRVSPSQKTVTRIEVRDYFDEVVTSIPFTAGRTVDGGVYSTGSTPGTPYLIPAPAGGWQPGYYRLYQYDDINAADIGAYGAWNGGVAAGGTHITILRTRDSRFPAFQPYAAVPVDWSPSVVGADTSAVLTAYFPSGMTVIPGSDLDTKARYALGASTERLTLSDAADPTALRPVTAKALTANVATLTLDVSALSNPFQVGGVTNVYGVGAPFDGIQTVTARTNNSISFAAVHADIGAVASAGSAFNNGVADALWAAQIHAAIAAAEYTVPNTSPYYDAARAASRQLWLQWPNLAVDYAWVGDTSGNAFSCYKAAGGIDGATFRLVMAAGTTGGTFKLVVTQADGVTPIETYDNLVDLAHLYTAVNGVSAYVWAVGYVGVGMGLTSVPVQISNDAYIGVKTAVQTLYPLGVTHYEGPLNEPPANRPEYAYLWKLFRDAVKAGNAGAKVMGPNLVYTYGNASGGWTDDTKTPAATWLGKWIAQGLGAWVDEWSTHTYHVQDGGDINVGRVQIQGFFDVLEHFGVNDRPVWVTEGTNPQHITYGIWSPRQAREVMLQTLLWEQFGVPRERNVMWYDISHGYWAVPQFLMDEDRTFHPAGLLMRVLAEETFGRPHTEVMTFGPVGDHIFLGSIYTNPTDHTSVAVMQAQSPIAYVDGGFGTSVTLTLSDPAALNLTVVNGLGQQSELEQDDDGRFKVPVGDIPTYAHLPAGVTATVVTCNDWPLNMSAFTTMALPATPTGNGNHGNVDALNDDAWEQYPVFDSGDGDGSAYLGDPSNGGGTLPDSVTLAWPSLTRVDRVVLWCGSLTLNTGALLDFDVQTSMDGATWTTQATVTQNPTCRQASVDGASSHGCKYETAWDRQWIHDVKFPGGAVYAKYLRVYVRNTTHGFIPDATGLYYIADPFHPQIVLQEIAVLCDANAVRQYAVTAL